MGLMQYCVGEAVSGNGIIELGGAMLMAIKQYS